MGVEQWCLAHLSWVRILWGQELFCMDSPCSPCACVGSLWIPCLPPTVQRHTFGGKKLMTLNSSLVWMCFYMLALWWAADLFSGCTLPLKAAGRDARRWINKIDTHSNVSPVAPSTMRNAPARLHCATSCWLAEWHCCLGIELLWPPGTWHWSTTLIRIGN